MAVRRRFSGDELLGRWTSAVRTQARVQAAARAATLALVDAAWRQLADPYDPGDVRVFTLAAADAVRRGRTRAADLVVADLRRVLDDAGVDLGRSRAAVGDEPRGITLEREMLRAPGQARWELSRGRDLDAAMRAGRTRAQVMADFDLALATRDAFADVVEAVPAVVGWRRMVHPELSEGGTCGLCIAAATRLYQKSDLMPLHARCHCLPFPVLAGEEDLAQRINGRDLDELYAQMRLTKRQALAKVRFLVEEHGELGPVLVQEGHRFRGPDDVDPGPRSEGDPPDADAGAGGAGGGGADLPSPVPDEPYEPARFTRMQDWEGFRPAPVEFLTDPGALQIWQRQGFDRLPAAVSTEAIDRAVAAGALELFRGLQDDVDGAAADFADQFLRGEFYPAHGVSGAGAYFSTSRDAARDYAGGDEGVLLRAALRADARVIEEDDLRAERDRLLHGAQILDFYDLGRFAAARGYDAILRRNVAPGEDHVVVLNRTALLVEDR